MLPDAVRKQRIMLVIQDAAALKMVGKASLEQAGYDVHLCRSADDALKQVMAYLPHLVIIDHKLADLSGRDLMVALRAAGIDVPFIQLMADDKPSQQSAQEIIQAYRMGARDVLMKPFRETELFNVVDRLMGEARVREEREQLEEKLREANYRLSLNLQDMQSLIDIQKALQSAKTEAEGFDRILDQLMRISDAHRGWMLIRDSSSERFILAACRNMPVSISQQINQPFIDKLSQAVIESGRHWMVSGEDLKAASLARLGSTALVMPIRVQDHLIGVLALARKTGVQFARSEILVIEAISDTIAMAVLNSRLYNGLKKRNAKLKSIREEAQAACAVQLAPLLQDALIALGELGTPRVPPLGKNERAALKDARAALQRMRDILCAFQRES
jgi:DNA-binding response OmpR family regulator